VHDHWIAERMGRIDASGIRKAFEMAKSMVDPINLSIGLPDFPVAEPVKLAAIKAILENRSEYTLTQGLPELRNSLQTEVDAKYHHADRQLMVTSGTAGGLTLALSVTVNPGEEVIIFDPYFVMYRHLVTWVGGTSVLVDTYPDFQIDMTRLEAAITPKTKVVIVNTPSNPTGVVQSEQSMRELAELCRQRKILLISDEVYGAFSYDTPTTSPARFDENVLVCDGFSKTHGMTGWRLGFAHGPSRIIQEMNKLQQFSFVCAPSLVQFAAIEAMKTDMTARIAAYKVKRDKIYDALKDDYEIVRPDGAFYIYPKAPRGTATEFVAEALRNQLLIIPGNVFSQKDTHFRISYAVDDRTLDRGIEVLKRLARK
jgi:aspartate aminotransferase/aminotransferase